MSLSTPAENKKSLEISEKKFDKRLEERNRKEEGSKNLKEGLENEKKKKKEEEVLPEGRKKKISEYFTVKHNKNVAYLEEGAMKENCALSGTARTARPSSPPSRRASRTSSSPTSGQEQLPPSGNRSSISPELMFTNGSTLCAQYRQCTADYFKREDDSGSRPTNVCGPITALRLANRRKVWETEVI